MSHGHPVLWIGLIIVLAQPEKIKLILITPYRDPE